MDGTLLNSDGIITQENENALKRLKDEGVEILIASGRTDLMLKPFIRQLDLKGDIICCNGGLVKDISSGEVIYGKPVGKEAAAEVIGYCFHNALDFLIYTEDMIYSSRGNPRAARYEKLNAELEPELRAPIEYMDREKAPAVAEEGIFKILISSSAVGAIGTLSEHFSVNEQLSVVSSFSGVLDIMAADISKGAALKALSRRRNVDLDKVIAFGDNYNDLEMFEAVGMPIAVGNAVEEAKSAAKIVTCSNNEAGVARAIRKYILGEN
jgi:hypothetical protein